MASLMIDKNFLKKHNNTKRGNNTLFKGELRGKKRYNSKKMYYYHLSKSRYNTEKAPLKGIISQMKTYNAFGKA